MANDLRIGVSGDTSKYERAMASAASATDKYRDSLTSLEIELMRAEAQLDNEMAASLERQNEAAEKLGKGMIVAGAGIAVGLGMAAREAVEWESAWAGVEKTVDGSPEQMAALEEELRGLARTLPATHSEIAGVAEAAGQLGVKRQDIAQFTEVMIAMGESTNLSADEAATSMARFSNIMGTPTDKVDRLGSAIVALGNDGASTEAEIVDMGLRIAAAGSQVGLTEAEVLALANTMSSLGIRAEAGGTAISTVMLKISRAVDEGGEKLGTFAQTAGMSADEFATMWQERPAEAMVALTAGLNRVQESGGSVNQTLINLGITGIRETDTMGRLANGHELLAASIDTGNTSWEENTALMEEAAKRYQTTESKVKIARNQLIDLAIDVGNVLLPALGGLSDGLGNVIGFFGDLPGPVKTAVTLIAALTSGILLFGGAALITGPKIAAMQASLANLPPMARGAGRALSGLLGVLGGPWGIAIVAATIGIGYFISKHQEAKEAVQTLADTLDAGTGAITEETAALVANDLAQSGLLESAKLLGVNLGDLVDAHLGNGKAIRSMNDAIDETIAAQMADGESTLRLQEAKGKLQDSVNDGNESLDKAVVMAKLEAEANKESGKAAEDNTDSHEAMREEFEATQAETQKLESDLAELRDELSALNGEAISVERATLKFKDQLKQLRDQVKDGTGSLDSNTSAGRANRGTMLDMIEAAEDHRKAVFDQTAATKGVEAATKASDRAFANDIVTMRKTAQQAGINTDEFDTLIAKMLGVPKKVVTQMSAQGLVDAIAKYRDVDQLMALVDGQHTTSKHTHYSVTEKKTYDYGVFRQEPPRRQHGGPVLSGGSYLVGEAGPEIVTFAQSGRVIPNDASMAMLAGSDVQPPRSGGSSAITIENLSIPAKDLAEMQSVSQFFARVQQEARRNYPAMRGGS